MHRGPPSRAICALLVLGPAGCGGELASDYTLSLVPHSLTGQAPFEGDRTVELVLTDTSGVSTVHYLGPVTAGEVRGEALPPIPAGATVGVLVEEAGGAQGAHDEDLAVAWGAVSVPDALATGDQQVALDVLVPEIYTLGEMGSLGADAPFVNHGATGSIDDDQGNLNLERNSSWPTFRR